MAPKKPTKKRTKASIRKEFNTHCDAIEELINEFVQPDNYAGSSSIKQLDRIREKFEDAIEEAKL